MPGHRPLGSTNDAALEDTMTLPTIDQARSWRGLTLVATDDQPVGKIEAIYVDKTTRQPEWALVHTGLFGSSRTFVPLADAAQRGDTVQVPHEPSVVREAPRLEEDAELSEEDEARLYAHYGIRYTTEESSSGLPAGVPASPGADTAPVTDATTELPPSSRLQADAPAAAGTTSWAGPTATPAAGTSWSGGADTPGRGRGGQAAAAGLVAAALAAIAAGLAVLRRRRRQPPSLGERVGQVGRDAADALTRAAEEVRRQATAATSSDTARQAAKGGRRAKRKAAKASSDAAVSAWRAAVVAAAGGLAAAKSSGKAARKAAASGAVTAKDSGKAAGKAARDTARKTAAGGAAAVGEGRRAVKRAGQEAAAVAAAIQTTPESRRKARKRKRARKRATAAVTGAARSVASAPAAAGRKVQQVDVGKRTRKVIPRRRRRSKMKVMGKLGMAVGAAVGYVLGAKAGRERYEQLTASARQLLDKPQVRRVVDSVPGDLGARVEQAANKAADKVAQAGDKVAASGSGTSGATSGSTTTTTTPTTPTTTTTTTTPTTTATTTAPATPGTGGTTETGTTAAKRSAGERKPKSS
jgi:PRC-barrel domain protein